MATEVNATLIKYDASGDQTIIYPKTLGTDIEITSNSNYSTTNLQALISALGTLAFRSYTIVTTIGNVASGTLVDGAVISDLNTTLSSLSSSIDTLSDTLAVMTGATSSTDGKSGLVPAPSAGEESYFLRADGTWVDLS